MVRALLHLFRADLGQSRVIKGPETVLDLSSGPLENCIELLLLHMRDLSLHMLCNS